MGLKFMSKKHLLQEELADKVTWLVDKVSRILNFIESKFGVDLNTPKAPPNSPGPISPEPLVRSGNGTRVFIGGLSLDTRERDVQEFCSRVGAIIKIVLKSGFCFVKFENIQDASDAVNTLNDEYLVGSKVTVRFAYLRRPRSYGGRRRDVISRYSMYNRGRIYREGGRYGGNYGGPGQSNGRRNFDDNHE